MLSLVSPMRERYQPARCSKVSRHLRSLIDPSTSPLSALPSSEHELLTLENLGKAPEGKSEAVVPLPPVPKRISLLQAKALRPNESHDNAGRGLDQDRVVEAPNQLDGVTVIRDQGPSAVDGGGDCGALSHSKPLHGRELSKNLELLVPVYGGLFELSATESSLQPLNL